ncbi:MAG TPA: zf-HC2 domain-containing protein [Candidatus Deferrimicrobiaceae bacterium]|jgi:hypothetical protein
MKCSDYRRFAGERLDGRITVEGVRTLDAHLAGCAPCRRAEQAMRAIHAGLAVDPVVSPDFRSTLFARLEDEALLPARRARLLSFPAWRWVAVPLTAAAGLALFLLVGRESGELKTAVPQLARQEAPAVSLPASGASSSAAPPAGSAPATVSAKPASGRPAKPAAPPALSPEEADIVANLDLLDSPSAPDDLPAGFDEMLTPPATSRG